MPDVDELNSPMGTTLRWMDVFRNIDQWDDLPKLLAMHEFANASTKPTGLARLCSPNVAYLMVDPTGCVQLFHHIHLDEDDGMNGGTNELWALQGGTSMAHA
jgi:hypothetical protein